MNEIDLAPVISLFLGTFVLEDAAIFAATGLISQGTLPWVVAFLACFLGISLGDLGLFALGSWAARRNTGVRVARWLGFEQKLRPIQARPFTRRTFDIAIFVSRIVPGTRVVTYLSAGYLQYPFDRFFLFTVVSVSAWVFFALTAGSSVWQHIHQQTGSWLWAAAGLLFTSGVLRMSMKLLTHPWQRRAWVHGFRKWRHFEFWPAWLFYLPVIPYVAWLALTYRSWRAPFLANPLIETGGWVGESKWALLEKLKSEDSSTLKAVLISSDSSSEQLQSLLREHQLDFPLIFKPDVGQRGFGVRVIRTFEQAQNYLRESNGQVVVQRLSPYQSEAGVFYVRLPNQENGFIFSVTDKKFPFVTGDGVTSLGNLILRNHRARMIAGTYFARFKNELNSVPELNQKIPLVECGNHCQGAIFEDGTALATEILQMRIDSIAKQVPEFYFGRFDIRYSSPELLKKGEGFHIIEINGAGSEATHIWDTKTSLFEAYRTLYRQWSLLFEVGHQIEKQGRFNHSLRLIPFLRSCLTVFFRKGDLTVSS